MSARGYKLSTDWMLWADGLDDIRIEEVGTGIEVNIPTNILKDIIAYEITLNKISRLEQMTTDDVLKEAGVIQ